MKKNGHDIFIKDDQKEIKTTPEMKKLIALAVAESLKYEKFEGRAEVSVTLCDGARIRELNRDFRGIDRVTDVLSFPLFEEEEDLEIIPLGDIVINMVRADEQAKEYGHSFERELAFLVVHSMLHLLGYDHEEGKAQESEMFACQEEILSSMGLVR